MNKNKILIINHYAGAPQYGMRFRDYDISKELIKLGFEVCIIAASFSHLRATPKCKSEVIDGIHYKWINVPSYKSYGAKRFFNMILFPIQIFLSKLDLPFTPDFIIASSPSPFTVLSGIHLKRKYSAKFIYEIRDIWPLSIVELKNMSKKHPLIKIIDKVDNLGLDNADAILSPLDNIAAYIRSKGFNKQSVVVPNGIAELNLPSMVESPVNDKFLIGYGGSLSDSNSIMNLVNAAIVLKDNDDILFKIVGAGERYNDIEDIILSKNLKNVSLLGQLPKEEFFKIMASCDILYKGNPEKDLYKYGVSSIKMVEYLLLKKPVIDASYGVNLIKESKAGIAVKSENYKELVKGILKLKLMDQKELKEMGERGFEFVQEKFLYKNTVGALVDTLKNL